jgi:hypothetical protein
MVLLHTEGDGTLGEERRGKGGDYIRERHLYQ